MAWIVANIRWIMIVSGGSTATMIYAAIAPEAALQSTFGETLNGPLAQLVVRNWGALIALVGAMLIYGAFDPPGRPLILIVAGVSKAIFIALVLSQGARYLSHQAGIAVAVLTRIVETSRLAFGPFAFYGNGALIVPAIGFVAYFVIKAVQRMRGVNIDLAYREIPPE